MRNAERVLTREALIESVWGGDSEIESNIPKHPVLPPAAAGQTPPYTERVNGPAIPRGYRAPSIRGLSLRCAGGGCAR
jgi:hypothetical protein